MVDSNGSPPHLAEHDSANVQEPKCRLCELRRIVKETQARVRPRTGGSPPKVAVGLAVPAIEAWLLYGVDAGVTEAAWINGMRERRRPYTTNQLKERLYATTRPSLAKETEVMRAAAERLCGNIEAFTACFPQGFGALAKELQSW